MVLEEDDTQPLPPPKNMTTATTRGVLAPPQFHFQPHYLSPPSSIPTMYYPSQPLSAAPHPSSALLATTTTTSFPPHQLPTTSMAVTSASSIKPTTPLLKPEIHIIGSGPITTTITASDMTTPPLALRQLMHACQPCKQSKVCTPNISALLYLYVVFFNWVLVGCFYLFLFNKKVVRFSGDKVWSLI